MTREEALKEAQKRYGSLGCVWKVASEWSGYRVGVRSTVNPRWKACHGSGRSWEEALKGAEEHDKSQVEQEIRRVKAVRP